MKHYRFIILLSLLCTFLNSCTNDTSGSVLELNDPVLNRMDAALTDSFVFQVDITVNTGPVQSYLIDPAEADMVVVINKVRRNEQNSIEILWQAVIDDTLVELSTQSQVFVANEETLIDAPHNHTQFDYDNDGVSNLDELQAGTCLLPQTESCTNQNLTDGGPTDSPTNGSSENLLLNGDFEDGINNWQSSHGTVNESSGEFCAFTPETAQFYWESQLVFTPLVQLEPNSRYTFAFDVRAEITSVIAASILLPKLLEDDILVFEEFIETSTTKNKRTITQFNTEGADYSNAQVSFAIGSGFDNILCFDDIELRIDTLE